LAGHTRHSKGPIDCVWWPVFRPDTLPKPGPLVSAVGLEISGTLIADGANKRIMGQASSPFSKRALVALVRRREPRGIWLYTICDILVVLYTLSVLHGIGAEAASPRLSDFLVPALWLSLPVAVAVVQVWRQTLLGWFLLLAGFAVVAVGLCYLLIEEQLLDPWPLTLLATAIAICVGLVWHRPTRGA
jgi:hypothetical protein